MLIIFFAFFYTAVVFNPADVAENMKKFGGYIPGIRPGPQNRRVYRTGAFADHVKRRDLSVYRFAVADACWFGSLTCLFTSAARRC